MTIHFTVITPTLMRPSLERACKSLDSQTYPNWTHLVICDDSELNLLDHPLYHQLYHPNRQWFQCAVSHKNVGNTCRHSLYRHIPDFSYVLYLDDDNYYTTPESLSLLSEALTKADYPDWGTFPMLYLGLRFHNDPPVKAKVDTSQLYHKKTINSIPAIYPALNEYCADGIFAEWLATISPPILLSDLPELTTLPQRSYGLTTSIRDFSDKFTVVIPNKYPDVIKPLLDSINRYQSHPIDICIIADGHDNTYGFRSIPYDKDQFIFSHAANLGFNSSTKDIILINDDVRITAIDFFERLSSLAYSDSSIGILSPLIDGGCGNLYMFSSLVDQLWDDTVIMHRPCTPYDYISFACVYIKRDLINSIGPMDEGFIDYGKDDTDYCIRAHNAGWKCSIVRELCAIHGIGRPLGLRGRNWSTSFSRQGRYNGLESLNHFLTKYPNSPLKPTFPQPHSLEGKQMLARLNKGRMVML